MLISVLLCLLPRFTWKAVRRLLAPSDKDILEEMDMLSRRQGFVSKETDLEKQVDVLSTQTACTLAKTAIQEKERASDLTARELSHTDSDGLPAESPSKPMRPRHTRRTSSMINMQTGVVDRNRGFAFSQDLGMEDLCTGHALVVSASEDFSPGAAHNHHDNRHSVDLPHASTSSAERQSPSTSAAAGKRDVQETHRSSPSSSESLRTQLRFPYEERPPPPT